MGKESKRFTVTVPPDLLERLRAVQETDYPECSRNEMLIDLICKGLKAEKEKDRE